jgi:hypothetical protein
VMGVRGIMAGDLRERPCREEAAPWLAAGEMLRVSLGTVRAPASILNCVFSVLVFDLWSCRGRGIVVYLLVEEEKKTKKSVLTGEVMYKNNGSASKECSCSLRSTKG